MATNFDDLVKQTEEAAEAIRKAREDANARKKAIDDEIAKYDQQLASLEGAVAALTGKQPSLPLTEKKPRGPAKGTPRTGRGEYDTKVIEIVNAHPDGIARGEIMKALGGAKVDNVLTRLKKENKIGAVGTGKSSKYIPA